MEMSLKTPTLQIPELEPAPENLSPFELSSSHCKLSQWWCHYVKASNQVKGESFSLKHPKPKKTNFDEWKIVGEKKCVKINIDYATLLRRNTLSTSVFEDCSDTFDWVFRSYQPNGFSSEGDTVKGGNSISTAFGRYASFLPPVSSLSHLSEDELVELATLLDNAPIESTISPQYLEDVTEKLSNELSEVSASIGQIGTLKELLFIISKAITAFAPYRSQTVIFDRQLFSIAFSKLTGRQRHLYTANYARDSLQLLSEYARHEIITYYSMRKRQVLARASWTGVDEQTTGWQKFKQKGKQKVMHLHQRQQPPQLCHYCHEAFHSVKFCPVLKNILCFQCFHYGHSSKKCPQSLGDTPLKMIAF